MPMKKKDHLTESVSNKKDIFCFSVKITNKASNFKPEICDTDWERLLGQISKPYGKTEKA